MPREDDDEIVTLSLDSLGMSLRWSISHDGRCHFAMCGSVTVGIVNEEADGRWSWLLYSPLIKEHARTKGMRPARDLAKMSLEGQWDRWLAAAGLKHDSDLRKVQWIKPGHLNTANEP